MVLTCGRNLTSKGSWWLRAQTSRPACLLPSQGSAASQMRDLRQITQPLCASISSSVNQGQQDDQSQMVPMRIKLVFKSACRKAVCYHWWLITDWWHSLPAVMPWDLWSQNSLNWVLIACLGIQLLLELVSHPTSRILLLPTPTSRSLRWQNRSTWWPRGSSRADGVEPHTPGLTAGYFFTDCTFVHWC